MVTCSVKKVEFMTYVITEACIDILDKTCVKECPVDCIYEGSRALYINPEECIDCGACEPVCPSDAIYYEEELPEESLASLEDNARFFTEVLEGRDRAIGMPLGAKAFGPVGVDTHLVRTAPAKPSE
jgi:NAD-dependent dihydropyrimidine dehydrogenase PreA subunit